MADYIDRHFIALMQEADARIERCVILDRFARRAAPASPGSGIFNKVYSVSLAKKVRAVTMFFRPFPFQWI
jgi:hypothetical protein